MQVGRGFLSAALCAGDTIDGSRVVLGKAKRVKRCSFQPPWPNEKSSLWANSGKGRRRFDDLSEAAWREGVGVVPGKFPTISKNDFDSVIAELARAYAASDSGDMGSRGVQIVGCRIRGDVDLFGVDLPFSLRLVGCVIDGAVIAHHAGLVTLDLSGSAIRKGVYATYVRTKGALRMHRTFCMGPVDFTSALIGGEFDARECTVLPLETPPPSEAFVGDRGLFSLALAQLKYELRLRRAHILGGLSLRGAAIERSVFLEDAVIDSPLATLERLAWRLSRKGDRAKRVLAFTPSPDGLAPSDQAIEDWWGIVRSKVIAAGQPDYKGQDLETWTPLAPQELGDLRAASAGKVPNPRPGWLQKLIEVDRAQIARLERRYPSDPPPEPSLESQVIDKMLVESETDPPVCETLAKLVRDSPRARTCAVRADGATIGGSFFADRLTASGRVRLKYVRIEGGLHLTNCSILSASAVARSFETFERIEATDSRLNEFRSSSFKALQRAGSGQLDEIALDLRDAWIRGSVALGEDLKMPEPTCIAGVVDATGVDIGDLDLRGLTVESIAPHRPDEAPYFLLLDHATIRRDIRLSKSRNVFGLSALNARISGHVLFLPRPISGLDELQSETPDPVLGPQSPGPVNAVAIPDERSQGLHGRIDLSGAEIGGDAVLLFHPVNGPELKLFGTHIEGELQILPAEKSLQLNLGAYRLSNLIAKQLRAAKLARPADLCAEPDSHRNRPPTDVVPRPNVTIDLTSARATVFTHPPSAWPQQGGLFVEGFKYASTGEMGPLIPFPAERDPRKGIFAGLKHCPAIAGSDQIADMDHAMREAGPVIYENPTTGIRTYLRAGFIALLFAASVLASLALTEAWAFSDFRLGWTHDLFNHAGQATTILFSIALAVSAGVWLFGLVEQPTKEQATPMANDWLARQETRHNRYRKRGPRYWSLDPYLQAARVLRASGRPLSAGRVELARLRERHKMLSARHHLVQRMFLYMVDGVSEYGFNATRLVLISVVLLLFAGMAFNEAYLWGAILPMDAPTSTANVLACPAKRDPAFAGSMFAFDSAVPIVNAGEEQRWRVGVIKCPASIHGMRPWHNSFLWLHWALHGFGLMLTSVIATAFAARAETWLAREEN